MMKRKTRKLEETLKNNANPLELTAKIDKIEHTLTQLENDFLTLSEEIHEHITISNVMRERAKKAKTPKEST